MTTPMPLQKTNGKAEVIDPTVDQDVVLGISPEAFAMADVEAGDTITFREVPATVQKIERKPHTVLVYLKFHRAV